jgi:hypothetical protein
MLTILNVLVAKKNIGNLNLILDFDNSRFDFPLILDFFLL